MAASYQCPKCGQVVPVMGLDAEAAPPCPVCNGALSAGPPPAAEPVTPYPVDMAAEPAPVSDDLPEIDIRRHDRPPAAPARSTLGNGARFGWVVVVVAMGLMRACFSATNQQPIQPMPQFQMPQFQPPQFQWQPNAGLPPFQNPGGRQDRVVQLPRWSRPVPGKLPLRLIASGPKSTRIAVANHDDLPVATTILSAFDGTTGQPAGELRWKAPVEWVDASLSADGSAVAVLLQQTNGPATRRLHVYTLPAGTEVLKDWRPADARGDAAADLWFALIDADRLLTVTNRRQLELWTVTDPRRQYSVALAMPAGKEPLAIAISPDRRMVAVVNRDAGFTFYDTATGAIRGRTAPLADGAGPIGVPEFSPDGRHLGCRCQQGEDAANGEWARWSCPAGVLVNRWRMEPTDWAFLDDDNVLATTRAEGERLVHHVSDGLNTAVIRIAEPGLTVAGAGRRLWYTAQEPHQLIQRSHLVAIDLHADLGRNDPGLPAGLLAETWRLGTDGLHRGP